MDGTPSLSSVSDDDSYGYSAGPLTPESSPLFRPTDAGFIVDKQQARLLNDITLRQRVRSNKTGQTSLPQRPSREIGNVCFIGAGYVGGPTAAVIALHNPSIRVSVLDRDESRIQRWRSAHLPLHEPGLDEIARVARDGARRMFTMATTQAEPPLRSPNLIFTTDSQEALSKADIIFIAVNTPTKTFGQGAGRATNMNAVDGAVRDISRYAKDGVIVVEKSTVPCGTARRITSSLHALKPDLAFEVLSNPEFLSEGCAVDNLLHPDRILIGSARTSFGNAAASALATLYTSWVPESKIVMVNTWSSELAKLVANAMLAQRISSINSISAICEETGADITEISQSIGLDRRIGSKFLKAGLGFGGSCFRKDIASLAYLAESLGLEEVADYWRQVNAMNELQRRRFTSRVIRQLDENLIGKKIAMLGFAFKKGTGDTRESLAVEVVSQLLQERPTDISIFDPYCRKEDILRELGVDCQVSSKGSNGGVKVYEDVYAACKGADAILIITDCDEFKCEEQERSVTDSALESMGQCEADELILPTGLSFELVPPPQCAEDCRHCEATSMERQLCRQRLDWKAIAAGMKQPRWVFDSRCVLNVEVMEELGFRVQSIGR